MRRRRFLVSLASLLTALLAADRSMSNQSAPSAGFVAAAAFVAVTPSFPVWAIGGLESILVAAMLAIAFAALLPTLGDDGRIGRWAALIAGIALACGTLARADFPLLVAAVALIWAALSRAGLRERVVAFTIIAGIPFVAFVGQTVLRLYHYGEWLPNTFYAKYTVTAHCFTEGVTYVGSALASTLLPLAPSAVVLIAAAAMQKASARLIDATGIRRTAFLLTTGFVSIVYTATAGGDYFPAFRLALPIYAVATFLLLVWVGDPSPTSRLRAGTAP